MRLLKTQKHTTDLLATPSCSPASPRPQSTHPPGQARLPPEKGEAALCGHRLGQEGLSRARGPVEQKAGAP